MDKKGFFSYGGGYVCYMEKIFDTAALCLIWLLCCLPVATVGASTTALYDVVHRFAIEENGYVIRGFFQSFRRNFKPACWLWAILSAVAVVLRLNLGIVSAGMTGAGAVFLSFLYGICLFFTIGTQLYAFPALSRFDMPVGWLLKVSIYMCFRHLPRTVIMVLVTAAAFAMARQYFVLVLVLPVVAHRIYCFLIEPVLTEHSPGKTGN